MNSETKHARNNLAIRVANLDMNSATMGTEEFDREIVASLADLLTVIDALLAALSPE